MSIVRMKKAAVIGLDAERESLISDLMDLGVMQIVQREAEKDAEAEEIQTLPQLSQEVNEARLGALEQKINETSLALETLQKFSTEKEPLFFTRRAMKGKDFAELWENREKTYADVAHILALNDRRHKLKEQINKKQADLAALRPWLVYDLPLEQRATANTRINLGMLPAAADVESLRQRIYDGREAVFLKEINRDKDLIYLAVVTMNENDEEVLNILKQHGYTPVPFENFSGTAEENLKRIAEEIAADEAECACTEEKIAEFCSLRKPIEAIYDRLTLERDREKVKEKLLHTKRTFMLEGWVPEPCVEKVQKTLEDHGCYYAFRDPEDGENVPVLTENGPLADPFEAITEMYSLPAYGSVDPNPLMAPATASSLQSHALWY